MHPSYYVRSKIEDLGSSIRIHDQRSRSMIWDQVSDLGSGIWVCDLESRFTYGTQGQGYGWKKL
jgi:hypothetical protein